MVQLQLHNVGLHVRFPCLVRGARRAGPRLPCGRPSFTSSRLLNLVITQGTPPRLEGCRPASRGLTLALMTDAKPNSRHRVEASGISPHRVVTRRSWSSRDHRRMGQKSPSSWAEDGPPVACDPENENRREWLLIGRALRVGSYSTRY